MSSTLSKRGASRPLIDLSDAEWKLSIGAALATVFTGAWFAVAQPASTGQQGSVVENAPTLTVPTGVAQRTPSEASAPITPAHPSSDAPSRPNVAQPNLTPVARASNRARIASPVASTQRSYRIRTRSS